MIVLEGKKAYTMSEAATLLNVLYSSVTRSVSNGNLPAVVFSGKKYITEDAIKEYSKHKRGKEKA